MEYALRAPEGISDERVIEEAPLPHFDARSLDRGGSGQITHQTADATTTGQEGVDEVRSDEPGSSRDDVHSRAPHDADDVREPPLHGRRNEPFPRAVEIQSSHRKS